MAGHSLLSRDPWVSRVELLQPGPSWAKQLWLGCFYLMITLVNLRGDKGTPKSYLAGPLSKC